MSPRLDAHRPVPDPTELFETAVPLGLPADSTRERLLLEWWREVVESSSRRWSITEGETGAQDP